MRRALAWVAGLALAVAVAAAGVRVERLSAGRDGPEELLYLPNGQYLRAASLGHASLMADAVYLWAIQFYAQYAPGDRDRYVEHVFGSVIAELDPGYIDPYWLGALILITEEGNLDAGLRLLDLGFERNPREWVLPYLAGWECYFAGRLEDAQSYFETAAAVVDAPPQVLRARAGVATRAGDVDRAVQLWRSVIEDPRSDQASRSIARRQLRKLRAERNRQALQDAAERFRAENDRWPGTLEELVRRSYIRLPEDGSVLDGFDYDPATGQVTPRAARVLEDRS